jgi:hypothetical protein
MWRSIFPGGLNTLLFTNNALYATIANGLFKSQELTAYDPASDEFNTEVPFETLVSRFGSAITDPAKVEIAAYRIKEDCFYDKQRKVWERRVIGICPVVKGLTDDLHGTDLCWIYMPELRKLLARKLVMERSAPAYIHTLDDVFYYSYYTSRIIKELNPANRSLASYCPNEPAFTAENIRIEKEMIEAEHNLWMDETAYKKP